MDVRAAATVDLRHKIIAGVDNNMDGHKTKAIELEIDDNMGLRVTEGNYCKHIIPLQEVLSLIAFLNFRYVQ